MSSTSASHQSKTGGAIASSMFGVGCIAAVLGGMIWYQGGISSGDDAGTAVAVGLGLLQFGIVLGLLGIHALAVREP